MTRDPACMGHAADLVAASECAGQLRTGGHKTAHGRQSRQSGPHCFAQQWHTCVSWAIVCKPNLQDPCWIFKPRPTRQQTASTAHTYGTRVHRHTPLSELGPRTTAHCSIGLQAARPHPHPHTQDTCARPQPLFFTLDVYV
jgi:hypothetical protein